MLKRFIVAATAAAFGLVPMAQAQTPVQVGQTVEGVLTATDAALTADRRHDCYRLDAPKGQAFEVVVVSSAFTPAFTMAQEESCRFPGDGGAVDNDGTGARYQLDGQGWGLSIAVIARRPGDLGAYRLEVKPAGTRKTGEALMDDMAELHSRIYAEEEVRVRRFDQSSARILEGQGAEWTVQAPANARFSILAVCDENCDDVDMAIYDTAGREISADRDAADFARVGFGAGPGQATMVTIQLEMAECRSADGCLAGAIIYQVTD